MARLPRFLDPTNPLEKSIEKSVVVYARSKGILSYKFTSPSRRSVPDRLFVAPGGRVYFMELKRKGCEPTTAQWGEIFKLREAGCTVFLVDSIEEGKRAVDLMR